MNRRSFSLLLSFLALANAALPWTGNFNSYATSTDLDLWSFANPVGQYQTYIFGNSVAGTKMSTYVQVDPTFKNPGECVGNKGAKVTIDGTSIWNNNQIMRRTELIANFPNSDETGKIYYKWSIMQANTLTRSTNEHQLVFFENHSCDLKFGGPGGANLYFVRNGQSVWNTPFTANTWFNFALEVDYTGKTCALWTSTGSSTLTQTVPAGVASVSPSDFHVGVLRLTDTDATAQSVFYSGVYAETTLTNNLGANCGGTAQLATSQAVVQSNAGGQSSQVGGQTQLIPNTQVIQGRATLVIITFGSASLLAPLSLFAVLLLALLM